MKTTPKTKRAEAVLEAPSGPDQTSTTEVHGMAAYGQYMDTVHQFNRERRPATTAAERVKAEGRYFRRIIRRNKGDVLTRAEVEVLVAMFNLWLHHRNGRLGYIHPSRDKIATKVKATEKTVSRSFAKLRSLGILFAVSNVKGGKSKTTRYRLNLDAVQSIFDPSNVTVKEGQLGAVNVPVNVPVSIPNKPGQNVPLSYDEAQVVPFPGGEGGK